MTKQARAANIAAALTKSADALAASRQLLDIGLLDDAMARLYYSMFHVVSAALLTIGVEATSHRALHSLLSQHLVRPGHISAGSARILGELFTLRNQADYDRHLEVDAASAQGAIQAAAALATELRAVIAARGFA